MRALGAIPVKHAMHQCIIIRLKAAALTLENFVSHGSRLLRNMP